MLQKNKEETARWSGKVSSGIVEEENKGEGAMTEVNFHCSMVHSIANDWRFASSLPLCPNSLCWSLVPNEILFGDRTFGGD